MRTIRVQPFGLTIRTVLATNLDTFGPFEAEPVQVVEDGLLGLARRSLDVGVLDTDDERAALAASHQPIKECRTRVADVQLTRWTWSESQSHRFVQLETRNSKLKQ